MLLGFNAVSNLYANVNNNNNNNNDNNNDNDFGSVSGNANDVSIQNNYMVSASMGSRKKMTEYFCYSPL